MLKDKRYIFLFSLWTIQGVIALVWLLLIPTDSASYSLSRLLLILLTVIFTPVSLIFVQKSRSGSWSDFSSHANVYNLVYFLALAAFILPPISIAILRALGQTNGYKYLAYAERFSPLAFILTTSGLEWYVFHTFLAGSNKKVPFFSHLKNILPPFFYILLFFGVVAEIVLKTGWGISPTRDGSFGNPPTPLLEWQIALAILLGTIFILNEARLQNKHIDISLFFVIYLSTCLLWLADPLVPSFFATPPRPPNFEPYPYSDALSYAQYAQSALVGDGFLWPEIPTRPLYVALLTWMYAIAGQNYYNVLILQTVLLAFFPAVLYLIGKELGSRPLGLMAAFLVAMRDITANHVAPFAGNISYSKIFFSEVPTALSLATFTLLAIRWLKNTKPDWYLMTIGAVLGAASLIRLQSSVLLGPLALIAFFVFWGTHRVEWFRGIVLITLAVALMLVPWLVRNYFASDGLVFDDPYSQSMALARRWSGDQGNTFIPKKPNETTAQYSNRMTAIALDNFKQDPKHILAVSANHFLNNMIDSLYILPARDRLESLSELLWPDRAFWQTGVRVPFFAALYATLLALGLAAAWRLFRWIGLLPFTFSISYNLWTALFWSSGDRFLIPIDWTWILYDCLGILIILRFLLAGLHIKFQIPEGFEPGKRVLSKFSIRQIFIASIIIFCAGAILPLTEVVFPQKYPARNREQLSTIMGVPLSAAEKISYGRAIYPRYYTAGSGEPGSSKVGYGKSDEARLVFFMVGPNPQLVIVPLPDAPIFFPHASNVWVIGNTDGGPLYARIVKVEKDGQSFVYYAP